MKHYLDLEDLDDAALARVLARAGELERSPISDALRSRVVGLVFMNPSLRTLASMQAGVSQLGGSSFVLTPGQGTWQLETRTGVVMNGAAAEHVREAIPVLAEYCDLLGVRCFADGQDLRHDLADPAIRAMAEVSSVPFVNLESAIAHPCQALADWKTLDDLEVPRQGGRFVLSWANHPKALPLAVPAAVVAMAARRGMDVTVLRPEGFGLPETVMQNAARLAARSGGSLRETDDRALALAGAQVIYAKSWTAPQFYGRPEEEAKHRARFPDWCVDPSWFEHTTPNAHFMHCLPVRRNVVVSDAVLDGPRSVVVRQAGNRLHTQKALMVELLSAGGKG
ncbi:MAG: N-acetylornithine carbamoyltransferase [Candidatus Eisenbacteria bacterium]|nr:N-acetylornithine carbamoyltransferase [Candidatus Eisenbacteria bacterium]